MSRKKIKLPGEKANPLDGIDRDILEYPDEYLINAEKGVGMYAQALRTLIARFERSNMRGDPEKLTSDAIHQTITFLTNLIPLDFNEQPAAVDELAVIFGAAVGMGAAAALDRGEVTMAEVEAQADCFYVAVREGVPRGILLTRKVNEQIKKKKFGEGLH